VKRAQQHLVTSEETVFDNEDTNYIYSPFYAAPELFAGSAFSVVSDMWSLGCVVFEILTGRQPFCASSLESLQEMVCGNGVMVGEELEAWSELVYSLLARSPNQRYISSKSTTSSTTGLESAISYPHSFTQSCNVGQLLILAISQKLPPPPPPPPPPIHSVRKINLTALNF
jgi:serine/threonine protein kinase